jgi:predicted RNase H-like HicB family nuclease
VQPKRSLVMRRYSINYERSSTGWGAYVPELPGLGVAATTRKEVERLINEGIEFHLEGVKRERARAKGQRLRAKGQQSSS